MIYELSDRLHQAVLFIAEGNGNQSLKEFFKIFLLASLEIYMKEAIYTLYKI